jgi:hypothetical protein
MEPSQHMPATAPHTDTPYQRRPCFFCYVRFSSKPQEDGDSERRQLEKGMKRAAEVGAEFLDAYTDRGLSGFSGANRDGDLGRMIEDVEAGKIQRGDIIWVENHDRLTRRPPLEAIEQFIRFLNAGVVLDINGHSRTKEILNQPTGFGLLVQDLIEMFRSYQESQRKSEMGTDTNAKKREDARAGVRRAMKAGAGCFVGRRCHAWLRPLAMPSPEGYLYEIVPYQDGPWREIARRAFLLADAGHGVQVISKRFNDEHVPPLEAAHRLPDNPNEKRKKRPTATKWTPSSVWQLLRCRAVVGEYQPHLVKNGKKTEAGDVIHGYYPPLFPDDPGIFYRVREAMQGRDKAGGKGRNGRHYANLIKGFGRCEDCGGILTLHTSSGRKKAEGLGRQVVYNLRCANAQCGAVLPEGHPLAGEKCPNGVGFPYARFELLLFQLFDDCMKPVLAALIPQTNQGNDAARIRLAEIEPEIDREQRALDRRQTELDDCGSEAEYESSKRRIRQLGVEIGVLKQERDKLARQVRDAASPQEIAERIRAGIAKVKSADPQQRYDSRVKLHDLLRERIGVMLHADRSVSVVMQGFGGTVTEALGIRFTTERIVYAAGMDANAQVVTIDREPWPAFDKAA